MEISADQRARNIFVMGINDFQRHRLESIVGAERFRFHGLFTYEELDCSCPRCVRELIAACHRVLDDFEREQAPVDGIIGCWDFPVTSLVPLICAERGLPGPSLDSVAKCTDKYWGRIEQRRCIPECTPAFEVVDPFGEDVAGQIQMAYPFWIKPIKSYSSGLGFRIDNPEQLQEALAEIRENILAIGQPFEELLKHMAVPEEILAAGGSSCLVEEIVKGREIAPEGWVYQGAIHINGIIDMPRHRCSFTRYEYPAQVDRALAERVEDATRQLIGHIGYDHACFNVEFLYDEEEDRLSVIEVNPRISQSHSWIIEQVDGTSNHELAVKVAIGEKPDFEHGKGRAESAAKCHVRVWEDGVVRRVPTPEEIDAILQDHPACLVKLEVEEGLVLHEMDRQDSYSYCIAYVFACGADQAEMEWRCKDIADRLDFTIDPIGE